MAVRRHAPVFAGLVGLMLSAGSAAATSSATGVWIDHTGRGAVEITECGGNLCGHVVWLKNSKHQKSCRTQILGNVRPVKAGIWDRGWIYDPDDDSKYSVELKVLGNDRLRVMGYMGSKLFSETMIWKRAPLDLKRCDGVQTAKATPQPTPPPAAANPTVTADPKHATTVVEPGAEKTSGPRSAKVEALPPPPPPPLPPELTGNEKPAPQAVEPEQKTAEAPRSVEDERPRQQRRSASKRKCTLDLVYITVVIPCDI